MAKNDLQRQVLQVACAQCLIDAGLRGGFVGTVNGRPKTERLHVLPKRSGIVVCQLQRGGVDDGVVETIVEQNVAQIVHIGKGQGGRQASFSQQR